MVLRAFIVSWVGITWRGLASMSARVSPPGSWVWGWRRLFATRVTLVLSLAPSVALAVGHRGRDAVGDEAHAAHAEGRARAEAARGDLQVLGVVLAVLHHEAGHAPQTLGEIHLRPALAQLIRVDPIDRCRDLQA